jgi:hypothetical protein
VAYIREITAAIRNDEPDKPGNWQSCKYMKKKSIENGDNIFWPGPKKKKRKKRWSVVLGKSLNKSSRENRRLDE